MQLLLLNREIDKMSDDDCKQKQAKVAQYKRRQVSYSMCQTQYQTETLQTIIYV